MRRKKDIKEIYEDKTQCAKREGETFEQYAARYLEWCGICEGEIRNACLKNLTNEDDTDWEDAWGLFLVRMRDWVVKKEKVVDSWKNFAFMCIKRTYIQLQNNRRKQEAQKVGIGEMPQTIHATTNDDDRESRLDAIASYVEWLAGEMEDGLGAQVTDTYFFYYRLKANGSPISYRKLAVVMRVGENEISRRIQAGKRWIKENEEILRIKYKKHIETWRR